MSKVKKLLKERGNAYGEAWRVTGRVIQPITLLVSSLITTAPDMYLPWMQILNKLVRILFAPHLADNWRDIIGYATLVYESLEHNVEEQNGEIS